MNTRHLLLSCLLAASQETCGLRKSDHLAEEDINRKVGEAIVISSKLLFVANATVASDHFDGHRLPATIKIKNACKFYVSAFIQDWVSGVFMKTYNRLPPDKTVDTGKAGRQCISASGALDFNPREEGKFLAAQYVGGAVVTRITLGSAIHSTGWVIAHGALSGALAHTMAGAILGLAAICPLCGFIAGLAVVGGTITAVHLGMTVASYTASTLLFMTSSWIRNWMQTIKDTYDTTLYEDWGLSNAQGAADMHKLVKLSAMRKALGNNMLLRLPAFSGEQEPQLIEEELLEFNLRTKQAFEAATSDWHIEEESTYLPQEVFERFLLDQHSYGVLQSSQSAWLNDNVVQICGGFEFPLLMEGMCIGSGCPDDRTAKRSRMSSSLLNSSYPTSLGEGVQAGSVGKLKINVIMAYVPLGLYDQCPSLELESPDGTWRPSRQTPPKPQVTPPQNGRPPKPFSQDMTRQDSNALQVLTTADEEELDAAEEGEGM